MSIVDKVRALDLPEKQFVVMGSAILEIKGIRKANDLDIIVTKSLFEKLKKDPSYTYFHKVGKLGDKRDGLKRGDVDLYWSIWDREDFEYFMAEMYRTELVDGIYFASLENLLEAKTGHWNREKDLQDVKLIREYLAAH